MKRLLLSLISFSLISTAHANMSSKETGNIVVQVGTGVLATSAAPTIFAGLLLECLSGNDESAAMACGFASLTAPTVSITSAVLLLKEETKQVEPDAYDFLAGGEMTFALEEQMNALRSLSPELKDLSDEYLITVLLEIANS